MTEQENEKIYGAAKAHEAAPRELFGSIVVSKHDFIGCEKLMVTAVQKPLLEKEADLMGRKWFDYRRLHPVMATLLFVKHYNRAYGNFLAETTDRGLRYMAAVKGRDILAELHRERHTFWKLRQAADDLGMRYDVFCNAALRHYIAEGWMHAPRPSHVLNSPEAQLRALDAWDVTKRETAQWAALPFYTTAQWTGHPDQLAYEDTIVDFIKRRPTKVYALHAALYEHDALRIERAIQEFSPDLVQEAIEICLHG